MMERSAASLRKWRVVRQTRIFYIEDIVSEEL
jgi:hypothetical protein